LIATGKDTEFDPEEMSEQELKLMKKFGFLE
jgi:hypothetical protein